MTLPAGPACTHPDCDIEIEPGRFACPQHWFALPRSTRNRIWATWRAYLAAPDNETRRDAWRRYELATGDAKAHWLSSD